MSSGFSLVDAVSSQTFHPLPKDDARQAIMRRAFDIFGRELKVRYANELTKDNRLRHTSTMLALFALNAIGRWLKIATARPTIERWGELHNPNPTNLLYRDVAEFLKSPRDGIAELVIDCDEDQNPAGGFMVEFNQRRLTTFKSLDPHKEVELRLMRAISIGRYRHLSQHDRDRYDGACHPLGLDPVLQFVADYRQMLTSRVELSRNLIGPGAHIYAAVRHTVIIDDQQQLLLVKSI